MPARRAGIASAARQRAMRIPLQFGILGLGLGGMYALSALGLVIVYRGSRTINLASGAIGMVGAYIFWELHDQHGMNFFAAAIPALAACAVIGAVSYLLFLRPLRNATPLAHILVTIGLLTSIVAIVGLRFPASEEVVKSSLPITGVRVARRDDWRVATLAVPYRRLARSRSGSSLQVDPLRPGHDGQRRKPSCGLYSGLLARLAGCGQLGARIRALSPGGYSAGPHYRAV